MLTRYLNIDIDIDIDIDNLFPKIRARQCHDRALQKANDDFLRMCNVFRRASRHSSMPMRQSLTCIWLIVHRLDK